MKRDGRCAEKHTPSSRRLCRQTSVTAGTILHASKLPRSGSGPPRMATHSNGISALSSRNSSVSALTAALGCSPTSCAPAWSTPSATRCRAWWKSTRPAFHSGPKTILPPEGKDAATTARCSSSAPSNWGRIPGRLRLAEISSYGAADLGFVETAADPGHRDRRLVRIRFPADRHNVRRREDRRSPRPAVDPPSLLQPQRMGARRLPRAAASICRLSR